ncbi:MAG: SUMF1/EgtB/PvdO family nonheme iron enzyme [Acidobacteria bacterium]|nr:SUMF1/EgtB/PvdO family nonheme iron enzyme [Acidobacteriota bacterium]
MEQLEEICPGCFRQKGRAVVCPGCGHDESKRRSGTLLPLRSLLHQQYVVGRELGGPGGFGITYLALDLKLDVAVAIKEFFPRGLVERPPHVAAISALSEDDKAAFSYGLDLFLMEARTLAKFDHPNVVRVRTFFEENGTGYLVMDYVEGVSLGEHLRRCGGRVEVRQALDIIVPILDGLDAVHSKAILHRDVTPHNIYLRVDQRPVLLDFGAARHALGDHTCSLTVIYTPGYAPYEQYIRSGKQGPWTDLYGAAATLYNMITGVAPPGAIEREFHDEIVPAQRLAPGVSERVSDAIMRALSLDPTKRPQTVTEFKADLIGLVDGCREPRVETAKLRTSGESTWRLSPSRRLSFVVALLMSAAIMTGAFYFASLRTDLSVPEKLSRDGDARKPTDTPDASAKVSLKTRGQPGYVWIDPATGIELAWIPPGEFLMGSGAHEDEGPVHQVIINKGFWMQTTETTQGQWMASMNTIPWKRARVAGGNVVMERDDCPAVYVSWSDAHVFINQLNASGSGAYRLPSEAEWEYACRAGSTGTYYFGNDPAALGQHAWFDENTANIVGQDFAHPVKGKLANPWGLYDMNGNVWEWCEDWYHPSYKGAPVEGSAWRVSPGSSYVIRGGSFTSSTANCRSANRRGLTPESFGSIVGFRVVKESRHINDPTTIP